MGPEPKKAHHYVRAKKQENHVFAIYSFYRDIVVCVQQGRCDKKTVCQLFAAGIQNFRLTYSEFLDEWESLWKGDIVGALKGFHSRCGDDRLVQSY